MSDEDQFDKWYDLGRVVKEEELSEDLRGYAGARFAQGNDAEAQWYRDLADKLKTEAEKHRIEWDKKYPT